MLGSVPSSLCLLTHVDHVSGPDDRDRRKTSSASGGYLEGIPLWLFSWSCSHYQERKKVTYLLLIWMVLEFCFCRIKAWCRGQAACEELRCWWLWCRGQKWFGWKVVSFTQDYHYACTRMLVFSCPCLGISLGIAGFGDIPCPPFSCGLNSAFSNYGSIYLRPLSSHAILIDSWTQTSTYRRCDIQC